MKLSNAKYVLLGVLITTIGLILILYPTVLFDSRTYSPSGESLISLTSPLSANPELIEKGGNAKSSSSKAIRLQLLEYRGINFDNSGVLLATTNYKAILAELKAGDTISILVLKNKLKMFGTIETPQTIGELFTKPPYLEFYSLKYKEKEYIINISNKAEKHRKGLTIPLVIMGSALIFFGIRFIMLKR